MSQLQIEHEGYIIRWNDPNVRFEVLDKETEQPITRKGFRSISDAEIWIGNYTKTSYKRVPILAWNNQWSSHAPRCPGEATSPVDNDQAWLSFTNPKSRYKQYMKSIWLDTPDNRRILDEVTTKQAQIKNLKKEVKALEDLAVKLTIDDFNVDGKEA
jgi:hypothetical protein